MSDVRLPCLAARAIAICLALSCFTLHGMSWAAEKAEKSLLNLVDRPTTIVCLGDSVTGVYYHTGGYRAYPEMLEVAIGQAVPNAKVKVINAGISGHSTTEGLARLDRDVLGKKPDLVTISFGLNDMTRVSEEQFRKNLDTLIVRCREAKSQVVLCTPNSVITTAGRPIEKLRRYCDIIHSVGRELNVPVCDQFAAGEALRTKDAWSWRLTLSDEIHPNMDGHKLMAEELCRTITSQSVRLADVPPPPSPLAKTLTLLKDNKPIKILAMPPFDALIGPALKQLYPTATFEVVPWATGEQTLLQIEAAANKTVRALKPNLVLLAVPRSPQTESDEEFARSYSWIMNWSLSFGLAEWDCVVVHPSVVASPENSPRDDLIRRLVKAQDLHLIDRTTSDVGSAESVLTHWIEAHTEKPKRAE